jgi:hypothetical protein
MSETPDGHARTVVSTVLGATVEAHEAMRMQAATTRRNSM